MTYASTGIKEHLFNTSSTSLSEGDAGMSEAWPRDAASRSLFSGNHGYMRNLRRSFSKGNSTLCPLEGAMETIYPRCHAEG